MTAHELASALLKGPDLPVVINGWGCDEGITWEVRGVGPEDMIFTGANDTEDTPRCKMLWERRRPCIELRHLP